MQNHRQKGKISHKNIPVFNFFRKDVVYGKLNVFSYKHMYKHMFKF